MALKGRTPNKAEKQWMDKVSQFGCIVCWETLGIPHSWCEIHHLDGKTKPNAHFKTIGLCYKHHRDQSNNPMWVSRHKNKKQFEDRYGTEEHLLERTKLYINLCVI